MPGAAMLAGAKLAVTPVGSPLTDKASCAWNSLNTAVDSATCAEAPGANTALVAAGVSLKPAAVAFATAVPVSRNVLGPRERQVRSSPTWKVTPWLAGLYAAPSV